MGLGVQAHPYIASVLLAGGFMLIQHLYERGGQGGVSGAVKRAWHGTWVYDASMREYRRVVSFDADGPLVENPTRDERRSRAAAECSGRRTDLVFTVIVSLVSVWYLHRVRTESWPVVFHDYGFGGVASFMLVLAALLFLLRAVFALPFMLIQEGLYLSGFQRMWGARVIDPPRQPTEIPGEIFDQMAYGKARAATAAEVYHAFGGKKNEPNQRFKD